MPLIEAALAFAITMLALSLIVSTFVELIHRIFAMREAGLKYMLGQMFDQVLAKYIIPELETIARNATPGIAAALLNEQVQQMLESERASFVDRMSANRAPMGVLPKATPADPPAKTAKNSKRAFGLWSGRDLATMTPAEFMERLGSIDIGADIQTANTTVNTAAIAAGAAAAHATDAVLKDVAQKFDAFGKEAGAYFEGRARLLSVAVAIGLAFAVHVDALDLFKTYLRDPNARAKVIEQSQAVTAQYEAAQKTIGALGTLVPKPAATPSSEEVKKPEETKQADEAKPAEVKKEEAKKADEVKKQVESLQKDTLAAIAGTNATVKQYADLGVPLGWTDDRINDAHFAHWGWFCPANRSDGTVRFWSPDCKLEERTVWLAVPTVLGVWFYLMLGGLLIGLGSPFWYDVVTGLTSLRNAAGGKAGAVAAPPAAAAAAANAQPVTPVGAFKVSNAARP